MYIATRFPLGDAPLSLLIGMRAFCVMIDAHKMLSLIVFAARRMVKGAATLTRLALDPSKGVRPMEETLIQKVHSVIDTGSRALVQRRGLFELVILGVLSREHVLMIGPPGTGKSAAVKTAARMLSGHYFEYLIGRFTEPSEIFGGLDLLSLREGRVQPVTENMLPEANIAFLDEVFLGSTAILNTLLGILNERTYKRGSLSMTSPLWSCFAASNGLPDDTTLAAFADRFLITSFVDPVHDDNISDLLQAGWALGSQNNMDNHDVLTLEEIVALQVAVDKIDLSQVIDPYAHIVRKLLVRGIPMSDRRIVRGQKLIATASLLAGRQSASVADLWPVIFMIQDKTLQSQAVELLDEDLKQGENPILRETTKATTYGPAAYAADLAEDCKKLLDEKPKLQSDPSYDVWQIRAESLLTRIDAGFSEETRPEMLSLARSSLLAVLEAQVG